MKHEDVLERALRILNDVLEADPEAITRIMDTRVPTDLRNWEGVDDDVILGEAGTIGPLGIINGIVGGGKIAARYSEDLSTILGFEEYGVVEKVVK